MVDRVKAPDTLTPFGAPPALLATFQDVFSMIQAHPRGWAVLTGIELGPAGVDPEQVISVDGSRFFFDEEGVASSFSFCINGFTCTAFENPEDGYRSSLSCLVLREGNHCSTKFQAVALRPDFNATGLDGAETVAFMLNLLHPSTKEIALSVGTDYSDDYYPFFIAYHDPQVLEAALGLDLILADDLDATLPTGPLGARIRI